MYRKNDQKKYHSNNKRIERKSYQTEKKKWKELNVFFFFLFFSFKFFGSKIFTINLGLCLIVLHPQLILIIDMFVV